MTQYLHNFGDLEATPSLGGKAYRLIQLFREGFQVPPGAVLIPEAFQLFLDENPALKEAIDKLIESDDEERYLSVQVAFNNAGLPEILQKEIHDFFKSKPAKNVNAWAIRSSGTREDGADSSFAGQFETYVNVKTADSVIVSVKQCWASLFGKKVLNYCKNQGVPLSGFSMCVVIQQFIPSDVSGVLFTVNPMTGNDKQMVIEAAHGQGEALVQGSINPDRYHYNWYLEKTEIIRKNNQDRKLIHQEEEDGLNWEELEQGQQCLNKKQIAELGDICLKIQQFYGEPQDIEWALYQGKFYILQSRPLTSIHFDIQYEWTTADLKDGGVSSSVCTPMMFSLYEYIFENTMPAYFREINILPERKFEKWFSWWFGIPYWNMQAAKEGAKLIPGFNERNFDKSLGIEPDYEGDGQVTGFTPKSLLKGVQILLATNKSIRNRVQNCKTDIAFVTDFLMESREFLNKKPDFEELVPFFKMMIKEKYLRFEGEYFFTIYDNSNAATFCQEAIEKLNKNRKEKINYLNLVAGLSNLSHVRPAFELWNLARQILKNPDALLFFSGHNASEIIELLKNEETEFLFKAELLNFIDKYQHHSLRELDLMVPDWDEDPTQAIDQLKSFLAPQKTEDPLVSADKQAKIFQKEINKIKDRTVLKKLATHREMLWWREEMRDNSSKFYHQIRRVLCYLAEKMIEKDMLKERDDIFYLTFTDLMDYCETANSRKYLKLIEKNQIFYQSYRNFRYPNEIWQKKDFKRNRNGVSGKGNTFKGIGGSHGNVTGRAVVIENIREADKIQDGDIMVTKFTDPAWTVYFTRISGLVTEFGGMLSHGAVVSREYGIPAVMGVPDITQIIKTGETIELDGDSGLVIIHKS